MPHRSSLDAALLGAGLLLTGCTGLVAGPEVAGNTPVPASRDSAYVRARRGLTAESFTMDVTDSVHGRLAGTRYPSPTGPMGTSARCRVVLAMAVTGQTTASAVSSTTRWVAPRAMQDKAPRVCEQERLDVMDRLTQTLVPPAE